MDLIINNEVLMWFIQELHVLKTRKGLSYLTTEQIENIIKQLEKEKKLRGLKL